jgi:hypothetical protein
VNLQAGCNLGYCLDSYFIIVFHVPCQVLSAENIRSGKKPASGGYPYAGWRHIGSCMINGKTILYLFHHLKYKQQEKSPFHHKKT